MAGYCLPVFQRTRECSLVALVCCEGVGSFGDGGVGVFVGGGGGSLSSSSSSEYSGMSSVVNEVSKDSNVEYSE